MVSQPTPLAPEQAAEQAGAKPARRNGRRTKAPPAAPAH
jgi:hypothetical protein